MGQFIGGAGAAFIMAAAASVIVKFLMEINIIKDTDSVKTYGRISLMTIIIGIVYVFIAAFMFNEIKERTNFFEFDKIFAFLDIDTVMEQCKNPDISTMFTGLMMPLYPCLVEITGKLVFEQYVLIAEFISFVSACVSGCVLYSMLKNRVEKEKITDAMIIASFLPYAFMLFAPTYVSLTIAFMMSGVYALNKKHNECFVATLVLSCLTSKLGVLLLIYFALWKAEIISGAAEKMNKSAMLSNALLKKSVISVLAIINGAVMFYLIRGV